MFFLHYKQTQTVFKSFFLPRYTQTSDGDKLYFFTCYFSQIVNGKVTITRLERCDPDANYPIKIANKLKFEGDTQVVEEEALLRVLFRLVTT